MQGSNRKKMELFIASHPGRADAKWPAHAAAADIKQYFQFTDERRSRLDPAFFFP